MTSQIDTATTTSPEAARPAMSRRRQIGAAAGAVAGTAARKTFKWTILLTAIVLILLAVLTASARIGFPLLSGYKDTLENRLSEYLAKPVSIGNLDLKWEALGPLLSATDVTVTEAPGRQVSLDELLIDLNLVKSIARGMPVVNELTLSGVELVLEYTGNGEFNVHGIASSGGSATTMPSGGVDVLSWLLGANQVELQRAAVTFINVDTNEQLQVTDLNVLAVNRGKLHQLRVDMQLPGALGGLVEVGIDIEGSRAELADADTSIYFKATDLKADAIRSIRAGRLKNLHASTEAIARLDADIQLELWGTVANQKLQKARGQLTAENIIDINTGQLVLDTLTTDVLYTTAERGWQIASDRLDLEHDGEVNSISNVLYHHRPSADVAWRLDTQGKSLALGVANRLALSLFDDITELPRARWLTEADPQGTLLNWQSSFALQQGQPRFSLQSRVENLNVTSAVGIPGVSNLGADIDITDNIGTISLSGRDLSVTIPSAFNKAVDLNQLDGEFDVDVSDQLRTVINGDVTMLGDGLVSANRVEVRIERDVKPHVFVQSRFSMSDVSQAIRYLPTRFFRPATTGFIDRALVGGIVTDGEFLMFGDPREFPYAKNQGVFRLGMDVQDASIAYLPGWPLATGVNGRFEMNGADLRGTATDGYIEGMRLSELSVRIPNTLKPRLELDGTSAGSLAKMVRFGRTGPLKSILNPVLSDVSATGRAQMDLSITVPLSRAARFDTVATAQAAASAAGNITQPTSSSGIPGLRVNGSVFLRNNKVTFDNAAVTLEDVDGAIGFTERSARISNLQARAFGGKVQLNSTVVGKGRARTNKLTVTGVLDADTVLENYELPLTRFAQGQSLWEVTLSTPMFGNLASRQGSTLVARSDLVGTQLLLPVPLGKSQASARRMQLSSVIKPSQTRNRWMLDYGQLLKARILTDGDELQAASAVLGSGEPNAAITEGLRIEGTAPRLAVDLWAIAISDLLDDLEPSNKPEPVLPVSVNLKTPAMLAGTMSLGPATIRVNTDQRYLNATVENRWLRGNVRYPREHWRKDEPALVRIAEVDKRVADALDSAPESATSTALDPREFPPLNIRISKLNWDLLDLENLAIRTKPTVSGMSIDAFGFAYQRTQLIGEGYWRLRDPQALNPTLADEHVSKLNLTLQSDDFGQGLTRLGFGGTLDEGEGVIDGSIVWNGPAYSPSLETVVGDMNINLAKGRILKVDPGAARLVGLFALETIPRRLSLDFKDLVNNGLDYESITGKVQLANGIAHAQLVQLKGGIGVVDVTGESNLLTREYNQNITVLPRVSAALPVIGVISGGATAGLGALFAGGFLKAIGLDIDRIGLRQYSLQGSWDNPELVNVPMDRAR